MKDRFLKLAINVRNRIQEESGQDLIEYALVVALIAFAAVAGMDSVAGKINGAFISIGSRLTSAMS